MTTTTTTPAFPEMDRALGALRAGATQWAALSLDARIGLLEAMRPLIAQHAQAWADAGSKAKGLTSNSALRGEEWITGPYALLYAVNRYLRTLGSLRDHGYVELPSDAVRTVRDHVRVQVFPVSIYDRLLLTGYRSEVVMSPSVRAETLRSHMAQYYRQSEHAPKLTVVLGAGNIAAIGPLDVLYQLISEGAVCLLKMNPVNDYLTPIVEAIFAPFIARDFVRVVRGGAEVGAYAVNHDLVDAVHITGSAVTHDAIVFGTGPDGAARKAASQPLLNKPITSELGNVSPIIVVPGNWSAADIRRQAENIATQKMHNAGFNCIAAQVLVLPKNWKHADALIAKVREILTQTVREAYYPGAERRFESLSARGESVIEVDARTDEAAFSTEAFCGVLAVTRIDGDDAGSFLDNAVRFCNDRLAGTLGASVLANPKTQKALGERFERALDELHYGCVGVNLWSAFGFLNAESVWGAYPGNTVADVGSGIGVVHNTFLFDAPLKTIVRGPWRPLTKPPWYVTNKQAADLGRRLVNFEAAPGMMHLPGIVASALRG